MVNNNRKGVKAKIPMIRNEFIYGKESLYNEKHEVIGMSDNNCKDCVGAINKEYSEEMATKVFKLIEAMAKYAFNKSHSSAYSVLTFQTAWLSLYYPVEFTVGCLASINNDNDKKATIDYALKRGIKFLQPDINKSNLNFSVEKTNESKAIRYGFNKIKRLGNVSLIFLTVVRELTGDFKDFDDFYSTINNKDIIKYIAPYIFKQELKSNPKAKLKSNCPINISNIRYLILAGAFDEMEPNRFALYNYFMETYKSKKEIEDAKDKGFDFANEEYSDRHKFALDLAFLDSYVSGNIIEGMPGDDLTNLQDGQVVTLPGIIIKKQVKEISKGRNKGNNFFVIDFQSKDGLYYKANLFEPAYSKYKEIIKSSNLPKKMESGEEIEKYKRALDDDVKRLKSLYMFKGKYSKEYNNFSIFAVKKIEVEQKSR